MKNKETLEEFINSQPYYGTCTIEYKEGIEVGAKWQTERMYSEEDMKKAIRFGFDKGFCSNSSNKNKNLGLSEKEWFEQFKKK